MSESQKEKKYLVEKRNILNEATWNNPITKQAYMFFLLYLSRINARDPNTKDLVITSDEYKEIMHFNHLNHEQIAKSVELLFDLKLIIPESKDKCEVFHVFKVLKYEKNPEIEKFVFVFKPDEEALSYIFDFKTNYFTYDFKNVIALNSCTQIRLYELMKQHEYRGQWTVSPAKLKKLLYIDEKEYPDFDNFRRRVLEPNKDIMANSTDIQYDYKISSHGVHGKALAITFSIQRSDSNQQLLTEPVPESPLAALAKMEQRKSIVTPNDLREQLSFIEGNVSNRTLIRYYRSAEGDIDLIRRAYQYMKTQKDIKKPVGFLDFLIQNPDSINEIIPVEPAEEKKNKFCNFTQRQNDYSELERMELEQFKQDAEKWKQEG